MVYTYIIRCTCGITRKEYTEAEAEAFTADHTEYHEVYG